jgi:hypothetical protein
LQETTKACLYIVELTDQVDPQVPLSARPEGAPSGDADTVVEYELAKIFRRLAWHIDHRE